MTRTRLINAIIRERALRSYLEIGCGGNRNFEQIQAAHKVGVDPRRGGTLRMTSDAFFRVNRERFDVIFIDGLHLKEQVLKDVDHALEVLNDRGVVVLHDCLPTEEFHQLRQPTSGKGDWTGDVWKAAVELRTRPDIDVAVLDSDWGIGVVQKRPNSALLQETVKDLNWERYQQQHDRLLRVLPLPEFREWLLSSPRDTAMKQAVSATAQRTT